MAKPSSIRSYVLSALFLGGLLCAQALTLPDTARATETSAAKEQKLQKIEADLKDQAEKKKELEKKNKEIESSLSQTREKMVSLARSMQGNENELNRLDREITEKQDKQQEIKQNIDSQKAAISKLILALGRIGRTPPEALIAKPGAPYDTAVSAMLLGDIVPTIRKRAEDLSVKLKDYEQLTLALRDKKEQARKHQKELEEAHKKLSALLDEREKLYRATAKDLKQQEEAVESAAVEAKNLKELVVKLKSNERRKAARETARDALETYQAEQRTATDAANNKTLLRYKSTGGTAQKSSGLPVSGTIRVGYNQTDDLGAKSKGLTIESRPGAIVISPFSGTVKFAGPFRRYGHLLIIDHGDGYYSLIAGFEKIDTVVGQNVSRGEPVGHLPSDVKAPTLYYELRKGGNPVNPAIKFSELG